MKKRTQKLLAMFLAVAMAISMTACGGSGAPASSGGGTGNTAAAGGNGAAAGEEKLSSRDTLNMAS